MDNNISVGYSIKGIFYNLELKDKQIPCRNLLEIKDKEQIKKKEVDAIFVMMNPGSSKPCDKEFIYQSFTEEEVAQGMLKNLKFVKTFPDKTQNQVMRIMKKLKWSYVLVVNLSDIREQRSSDFYKKTVAINNDIHSIFSVRRKNELNSIINVNIKNIVVAWGTSLRLKKLIELALASGKLKERKGYAKEVKVKKMNFYYYHPWQRSNANKERWIEMVLDKF